MCIRHFMLFFSIACFILRQLTCVRMSFSNWMVFICVLLTALNVIFLSPAFRAVIVHQEANVKLVVKLSVALF